MKETDPGSISEKISTPRKTRQNSYLGKHQEIFTWDVIPGAFGPNVDSYSNFKLIVVYFLGFGLKYHYTMHSDNGFEARAKIKSKTEIWCHITQHEQ